MGSCIICGADVDGAVCDTHQEDVCFEFKGNSPNELTPGRFYRGRVDGYADFGVFVNLNNRVTGLLHHSKLDVGLNTLDWEPGDDIYVQVTGVRDNGNVDLGWSIRQAEDEFRGSLIDDPELAANGVQPEAVEDGSAASETGGGEGSKDESASESASDGGVTTRAATIAESESDSTVSEAEPESDSAVSEEMSPPSLVEIESLDDREGERVRIEGEVVETRQTSGPTVFHIRDATGTVRCAAFESAGVRAYPEVGEEDLVRLDGEVERRHGETQIETESLDALDGEDADEVQTRIDAALYERAEAESQPPLIDDGPITSVDSLQDAATTIRRAVFEGRRVVIRHAATADGHLAATALEHAVLPLIRAEHPEDAADYRFVDRRPVDDAVYGPGDATRDLTSMLDATERHDDLTPLIVLVGVAATDAALPALELLSMYDAERMVVEGSSVDSAVADAVETVVAPDDGTTTATALASNLAIHVADVREEVSHLPAVSHWEDVPEGYVELAAEAGYDDEARRELREAIALCAHYAAHENKRQLVADLAFGEGTGRNLAAHVAEQFREKLFDELDTALVHVERTERDGVTIAVLDTEAFTHRFDFPPRSLLLDALHRELRDDGVAVTCGVDDDSIDVRSDEHLDVRSLAEAAAGDVPDAAIEPIGGGLGGIRFLRGERDTALDAVLDAIGEDA